MKALDLEQQLWLAQLAIRVIWCDGDLSKEEFDAFSKLTAPIGNAGHLNELMKELESPVEAPLEILDSVPQVMLPQVYQELVALAICDWDLNPFEEKALKKIGKLFSLSDSYQKTVFHWAKDGIEWQRGIVNILPPTLEIKKFKMPLHQLTDSQRVWFADALLAVFLNEDGLGKEESNLVEQVVRSIEDSQQKSRVIALIKNNLPPRMVAPDEVSEIALYLGLIEIIKVLASNNGLSHRQSNFITNYVKLSELPDSAADAAIHWAKEG
ncbi:MAG: hypothetical protein QNL04_08350, partial [SAR324 cluster bacterium]|nr:hypothetical protein [SAR324 cluster bacterium]